MFQNWTRIILWLVVFGLLVASAVVAQDDGRTLTPGVPVSGSLDADNVAQVYNFTAAAGDQIGVTASNPSGLGLSVVLTDDQGVTLAQTTGETGTATLTAIEIPDDGTYYVTVLAAPGVTLPAGSTFALLLSSTGTGETVALPTTAAPAAETTPVPASTPETAADFSTGQIVATSGLEIGLTWTSGANLDLEVRDPVGGSLRFATPDVNSGGTFTSGNINAVCDALNTETPTEVATWPAGVIPTGSYELLIYYQPLEACPTTDPASFTISVVLDNEVLQTIEGSLLPNEVFLSSFRVADDGTLSAGDSGLYTDTAVLPPVPASELLSAAQPIERDVVVSEVIRSTSYYDTYSFAGQADDLITVTMDAVSGSLDTLLLLLDPNGNVIDSNDDREPGITNSTIANRRLTTDGTYTIVATRYGKDVGGTEGGYELLLTGPSGVSEEVLALNLPQGDIQISLVWNTNADLQLLVRDPRGDSVYDDIPSVPSGGQLALAGNVSCTLPTTGPVSYIYWPQGRGVPGLYEVEVWYQNSCNDTRNVIFDLNIEVDGELVFADTVQPLPDQRYLTSFVLGINGEVDAGPGGFIGTGQQLESQSIDFRTELETAQVISSGQVVNGSITADNKFDLYTFAGTAGELVTISLEATAGQLDTTLFLIDPNGFQIAVNDDAVVGETTNSLISEFRLPQDGQYIIIATHFGMLYGGTTGTYSLSFVTLDEQ